MPEMDDAYLFPCTSCEEVAVPLFRVISGWTDDDGTRYSEVHESSPVRCRACGQTYRDRADYVEQVRSGLEVAQRR